MVTSGQNWVSDAIARRWGQKETQQSNRLLRRRQGEVKGQRNRRGAFGGRGELSRLSLGGGKEDGGGRGGSAPDNGAGVVSVGLLPRLAIGGGRCRWIVGEKGAGGRTRENENTSENKSENE